MSAAARRSDPAPADPVLAVERLTTVFDLKAGQVKAVNDVSFTLAKGEILGLVGESGSGKSVTGLSILGLIEPPGRIADGAVRLAGRDIAHLKEPQMRCLRGKAISMIFQDPMTTLNPVLTIGRHFHEVLRAHERVSWNGSLERAEAALAEVGIPSPRARLKAYPHELSGGMRQRVCIALSLIGEPDVVIADEPTTALDVTIQSQILQLVQDIVARRDVAMVWITHDLSVVAGLCDRVAVMYGGRLVEIGPVAEVLAGPAHPYTQGLLGSIPNEHAPGGRLVQIAGTQPSPLDLPSGCAFRTRCPQAAPVCETPPPFAPPPFAPPAFAEIAAGRQARCHFPFAPSAASPAPSAASPAASAAP